MTATARSIRTEEWAPDGLYMTLLGFLPHYRTRRGKLDVRRLGDDLDPGKSPEAIWKWLRKDKFLGDNARAVIRLAATPENRDMLIQDGRQPPTMADFIDFV